ncbi:D-alanyl-D-alanine carboxypeptidase DacB [Carnimonas sp. R-84981]|uniref:D-alanyl-D-alanine carboxypeptidase/D-alanyl-D-alanine endopeptidase n=1 Tax=Carnimonas bestiolae TaxID=3402172 RepID=UPI003EDBACAB
MAASNAYNPQGGKYWQSMALLCAALLLLSAPLMARAVGLPALSNLAGDDFDISAEVKMLDSGQVVAQQSPRVMLTPASLSKLYVAGAALDRYGPQHRFTTSLYSSGQVRGNVLHGDLIVDGGGDPAMTTERYWTLVQQLRARGIQRVDGRVVLSQWPFGPTPCVVTDRCQARSASSSSYDALLSPVAVDYAAWCTQVIPGAPGGPARVAGCFSASPLLPVNNKVKTVGGSQPTQLSARRTTSNGNDSLTITGQVSTSSGPTPVYRSASDPAQETVATLRQLFQQSGVAVAEGFTVSNTVTPRNASLLASVQSQPLQMALMDMLNYSNNFMADMLTVDLSAATPASLASGTAALKRFVDKVPGHGPLALGSGSGLTPESHTSARGLTALMDYMYHQPQLFPTFSAGMQTPSNGVAHHIQHGSINFQNNVMVKTGTLNDPVPVRTIAGYFRGKSGRWGTFAVLVQGRGATPYLTWPKVMEAVADDMSTIIEHN